MLQNYSTSHNGKTAAVIFTSFKIDVSRKKQINRNMQYVAGVNSILRNLPKSTTKVLVDNTGYLKVNPGVIETSLYEADNFYILSYSQNSGISNKGIGELEMLDSVSKIFCLEKFDRILYLTGRYIYSQPYTFQIALKSGANFVYCKPTFFGLDGQSKLDGDPEVLNDMFFCGDSAFMSNYLAYFRSNRSRMENSKIPSEKLLWEFHESQKEMSGFISEQIPAIGLVRATSNRSYSIDEIQVL
jgi:hypothetical protein